MNLSDIERYAFLLFLYTAGPLRDSYGLSSFPAPKNLLFTLFSPYANAANQKP